MQSNVWENCECVEEYGIFMMNILLLNWGEFHQAPSKPGIYSWYYRPKLSKHDINVLIERIKDLKENNQLNDAKDLIHTFLYNNIYKYFLENPYNVKITGQLISSTIQDLVAENQQLKSKVAALEVKLDEFMAAYQREREIASR